MPSPDDATPGSFCWLDLAASDADAAMDFYAAAFGWKFATVQANGGSFTRCVAGALDVGSLYPLRRAQLERGVPSHWTPYVRVDDIDALTPRIAAMGGRVLVQPFDVERVARIALIEDSVGALLGLRQPLRPRRVGTIPP
jgi:predicted enzyme related to lactoylglutathione lyase